MTQKIAARLATLPKTSGSPALFQGVRRSTDASLVAFGAALLVAFALHAGAFLPRFAGEPPAAAPGIERAPDRAEPAYVASRRPAALAPAAAAPCEVPAAPKASL